LSSKGKENCRVGGISREKSDIASKTVIRKNDESSRTQDGEKFAFSRGREKRRSKKKAFEIQGEK